MMAFPNATHRLLLGNVIIQLIAVKRQALPSIVKKTSPCGDPYIVAIVRLDMSPRSVTLLNLTIDILMN